MRASSSEAIRVRDGLMWIARSAGATYREIGAAFGLHPTTVKTRINGVARGLAWSEWAVDSRLPPAVAYRLRAAGAIVKRPSTRRDERRRAERWGEKIGPSDEAHLAGPGGDAPPRSG